MRSFEVKYTDVETEQNLSADRCVHSSAVVRAQHSRMPPQATNASTARGTSDESSDKAWK